MPRSISSTAAQVMSQPKRIIFDEMNNKGLTYKKLSQMFFDIGYTGREYEPDIIKNKINRDRFSARFFVECLQAMDIRYIDIAPLEEF
jgi:hypothetical protein